MIHIKGLTFGYGNGQEVLHGLDFDINKGEIFGFLGPSGAGKTTTQKLIIGLLNGYGGSISVGGRERSAWGDDFYRMIGVAFEQPNLYLKLTGLENLNLMGSFYEKSVNPMPYLERVGLKDAADKRVETYSKGMRMRLNFVRAIQHRPKLLFLDEPTAGLDPVNAQHVKGIVRELKEEGCTIFLTTHNMTVADQLCDQVAFMVGGKLAIIDAPSALKEAYGSHDVEVKVKGEEKHVFPLDDLGENQDFLSLIRSGKVEAIHSQDATLEDIFIRVTGSELS